MTLLVSKPPYYDGDVFVSTDHKLRAIRYGGRWAWIAKDVETILGLTPNKFARYYDDALVPNRDYVQLFDDVNCRWVTLRLEETEGFPALDRTPPVTLIYHSGLKSILGRSRKPAAKPLLEWLSFCEQEVLPSLLDECDGAQ